MFASTVSFRKNRSLLGKVADAVLGPQVHRQIRDVMRAEHDRPDVGSCQSDDHVKRCRFPGAIGSQQSDNFALRDLDVDVAYDGASFVSFRDADSPERDYFLLIDVVTLPFSQFVAFFEPSASI